MRTNVAILIFSVVIGLYIRLVLAFLPGFQIDVNDWYAWALRLNEVGITNFYSDKVFSDYTPGYMYILGFLGYIKNLFQMDAKTFYILLKLPGIFSEIILGVFVYKMLSKHHIFFAKLALFFILLNPALIFNSSIWGQIDSILALFLVLTIYYLKTKNLILSSIFFGIAFLIKPQTIAILPIYLLFILRNFNVKNLVKIIIPAFLVVFLSSYPFFVTKPFTGLISLVLSTANYYSYTSLFAYNFWGIIGFWIPDTNSWNNISYQTISLFLLFIYWMTISFLYLKGRIGFYTLAALACLGFYFLPTRVHERYLYPAIPFLILTASFVRSYILYYFIGLLSIIHFLNLYYVYVYYNEIYLNLPRLLYNGWLYNLLDINQKNLSLISTGVFIIITMIIIKQKDDKKFES